MGNPSLDGPFLGIGNMPLVVLSGAVAAPFSAISPFGSLRLPSAAPQFLLSGSPLLAALLPEVGAGAGIGFGAVVGAEVEAGTGAVAEVGTVAGFRPPVVLVFA